MKTYLVTGGAGFIGSNYILQLLYTRKDVHILNVDTLTYAANLANLKTIETDPRYKFIKADIADNLTMKQIFAENDIDYIINFAAESHVDRSIIEPHIFIKTNVLGTINLLNCARKAWMIGENEDGYDMYRKDVKFLQVSTDEVYGSLGATGYFSESCPLDPHSPYSASKASADMLVKAFGDTYAMPINITRSSNNYGPFQFPEKLIPLMLYNACNNKPLPIYGDGLQVRDWIHVDDHCAALNAVIENGSAGEIYNIGAHNEYTNLEIVRMIIDFLHTAANSSIGEHLIKHVADRKGHDRRYAIDASKIKTELGWYPKTTFETGIKNTLIWYLDNQDWMEQALMSR